MACLSENLKGKLLRLIEKTKYTISYDMSYIKSEYLYFRHKMGQNGFSMISGRVLSIVGSLT